MREYRRTVRENRNAEKQRQRRLRELANVDGVDENGLRLDRREFKETKDVLNTLYFNQMGWHRNRLSRYQPDPNRVIPSVARRGLPEDRGIQMRVRDDGQAWFGWRRTPGGYYFAVGGTEKLDAKWQYDAETRPGGYPSESDPRWRDTSLRESSPEWTANDGPIPEA